MLILIHGREAVEIDCDSLCVILLYVYADFDTVSYNWETETVAKSIGCL